MAAKAQARSTGQAEETAQASPPSPGPLTSRLKGWGRAHRAELLLFAVSYVVLACFSSQRFLRQSAAPHFIYQAQAWLDGRMDIDPQVLPNPEDWACVREEAGEKVRCVPPIRPTDKIYVSFPDFPALVMLPFVAVNGYQFNDTSFGVFVGALAIALFFSLLQLLSSLGESARSRNENLVLALLLGFGTLFFYCAIRGEVWFSAQVMGVALTCLYLRFAVRARRPFWAGVLFSMAVLTRTPLLFAGSFFLVELLCPEKGPRLAQLKASLAAPRRWLPTLGWFVLGMAPLAIAAALYNQVRFGSPADFGHNFLFNNRVNADIDTYGLFNLHYLARNLQAAFLLLPRLSLQPLKLGYSPYGLSLFLTLPILVLLFTPKEKRRLDVALWLSVAVCALPGLLYQNTGYMQFGFRFSLDYTVYLLLLFALGGWSLKNRGVQALLVLGVLVNVWGAVAFHGYTEYVRHW
jgi:hypothetical protein